jgi:N-acetylglucosaminyl-diphospho-decaprenol L-rhamnosyltransferase
MSISIVVAVFNQVEYTRRCFESLAPDISTGVRMVVVDNGSSDGTKTFLASQPGLITIRNSENAGCARAWNQGVKATNTDWVIILNNDVILTERWLDGLVRFTEQTAADIVCPAMREGELNYDLPAHARHFVARMMNTTRPGIAHGVCFLVRRAVFEAVGLFDENYRFGQCEETDFFLRVKQASFRTAITGASFIHHFGSVTQKALFEQGVCHYEDENRAYFRKKWQSKWWRRRCQRMVSAIRLARWQYHERQHGYTLKERWKRGKWAHY